MKPSDLYLGIIDFLGILVPGMILTFLHGHLLLVLAGVRADAVFAAPGWALFLVASYVLGHILLGLSVPFNRIADQMPRGYLDVSELYDAVKERLPLPAELRNSRKDGYYAAFSYLRLHAPAALTEVERQAAEYKLFRSLTLIALLDVPLSALSGALSPARLAAALLLAAATGYRFIFLHNWTYRLAFEFYGLAVTSAPKPTLEQPLVEKVAAR